MGDEVLEFKVVEESGVKDHYERAVTVTSVTSPYRIKALIYQCPLNVDWDGSARAYGVDRPDAPPQKFPLQKGLNAHEKGQDGLFKSGKGGDGTWSGVYSLNESNARYYLHHDPKKNFTKLGAKPEDRLKFLEQFIDKRFQDGNGTFPVVQITDDAPAPGYYVSMCPAVADPERMSYDQRKYWDAATIAYGALSAKLGGMGVKIGDFGLIIRKSTGKSLGFFFGDAAGKTSYKVGECSGFVKTTLAPNPNEEDQTFSFLVFPGSGVGYSKPQAPQFIDSKVRWMIGAFSRHANARELAERLALGAAFGKTRAGMTSAQSLDFQNIKKAFMHDWGWDVDMAGGVPVDDSE